MAGGIYISQECDAGYLWWTCNFDSQTYSGCCAVNACQQKTVGCPASAQQPTATASTSNVPSSSATSRAVSSGLTTSTVAPSTSVPASDSSSSGILAATAAANSSSDSGYVALPIGALVGIVIGCAIVAIVAALWTCMWWGRHKRKREEQERRRDAAEGDSLYPSLKTSAAPMMSGHPPDAENLVDGAGGQDIITQEKSGYSPNSGHGHMRTGSSNTFVSAVSPNSTAIASGTPSWQAPPRSELDSTPMPAISELDADVPRQGTTGLGLQANQQNAASTNPLNTSRSFYIEGESSERPRATLNSSTGDYATSWTKFSNVQL
ncbi:hypothetical protein QBC46DRAFT_89540 [Diplogelasinospora grovesii]|uniref:Uncharacterized protein n=1 Tax=Diplogelasinospora grovesii TaxID=303347 RepID=A0AAN6N9T6_9PEZI|nr:hypothetical protein QBC46DRAFT_89540 [Diplogelasinospora grovesii]